MSSPKRRRVNPVLSAKVPSSLPPFPEFQKPLELGCLSSDAARSWSHDSDAMLRAFVCPRLPCDLHEGFERFIAKPDEPEHLDALLAWIRARPKPLNGIDVVSWRGTLSRLAAVPYSSDPLIVHVQRWKGCYYLDEVETPHKAANKANSTPWQDKLTYAGHRFEGYCTAPLTRHAQPGSQLSRSGPSSAPGLPLLEEKGSGPSSCSAVSGPVSGPVSAPVSRPVSGPAADVGVPPNAKAGEAIATASVDVGLVASDAPPTAVPRPPAGAGAGADAGVGAAAAGEHVVNTNECYCSVVRTKLAGRHSILLAGEVDCIYESGPRSGPRPASYVELKTHKQLFSDRDTYFFERDKLLRCWCQCFLLGVENLVFGFRDRGNAVRTVQPISTAEITRRIKGKHNMWHPSVCINFLDQFLSFVKACVPDDSPSAVHAFEFDPLSRTVSVRVGPTARAFLPPWFLDDEPAPSAQNISEPAPKSEATSDAHTCSDDACHSPSALYS